MAELLFQNNRTQYYFPQTAYELIRFTTRENQLACVLEQPLIAIKRSATPKEINEDLSARGFRYNGINDALDETNGVILRDMHQENVVIADNGNLSYIDPIIQFTERSLFVDTLWAREW